MQRGNCNVILFNVQKIKYFLQRAQEGGEKATEENFFQRHKWHGINYSKIYFAY